MQSRLPVNIIGKMLRTPDIFFSVLDGLWKKHLTAPIDYKREDNVSNSLKLVSIRITNACNLKCKMCGQWGMSGYNHFKENDQLKKVVDISVYKKMIDDLKKAKMNPFIYIWGGEPFLYPNLIEFMQYVKQNKFTLNMVTNGIRLKKHAQDLVDMQLDALMLSLDGPEEVHDNIRGVKGTYKTLMEGIEAVKEAKAKAKSVKPYIVILTTVTKENAPYTEQIFEIGEKMGFDAIGAYLSWFTTEQTGLAHTKIMEEKLGCTPYTWKGYVGNFEDIDIETVVDSIEKLRKRKWAFPYIVLPNLKSDDIRRYYKEPNEMFGYDKCIAPWYMTDVMANGDIVTCRDYSDYVVGNINTDNIVEVHNNEKYKKFRQVLKEEGGLLPICARCCGLMGF